MFGRKKSWWWALGCWTLVVFAWGECSCKAQWTYTQQKNVVFDEVHGVGLLMDIFVPKGRKNGLGIVDVVSGAWYSDRGKLRDHQKAGVYAIFCAKGFTVFAVRPGSVTKFTALEMLEHVRLGIRWVKEHAKEYKIDPQRLGLIGASAGGHLAALAAVTGGRTGSGVRVNGHDVTVAAVGVFFPPTDFLVYGDRQIDVRGNGLVAKVVRRLVFPCGVEGLTDEQIRKRLIEVSPARQVTSNAPPFLIIHGDADPLVPLQQSKKLVAALQKAGVPAKLIIKPGGGHPWLTIPREVGIMADWFIQTLNAEGQPPQEQKPLQKKAEKISKPKALKSKAQKQFLTPKQAVE